MKIVQGDEIPLERGLEHRGGTFHFRRVLEGEAGRLDNYQLSLGQMGGDFYSPRHRHNFEQLRFQLEGTLDYDRNGKMAAGMVGYFPEGMHYGPQSQDPDDTPMTAVLQFGGASGSGYLSRSEAKAGMDELAGSGEFKDGVFRRRDDADHDAGGKRNVDGYQAIWEHRHKRPMTYPAPRYSAPIFMDPANYDWQAEDGAGGVSRKLLGVFSECRTEAGFLRLDADAAYDAGGRSVYLVLSGAGAVEDQPFRRFTTVFVEHGETARFEAGERSEILHFGLPDLRAILSQDRTAVAASAAE